MLARGVEFCFFVEGWECVVHERGYFVNLVVRRVEEVFAGCTREGGFLNLVKEGCAIFRFNVVEQVLFQRHRLFVDFNATVHRGFVNALVGEGVQVFHVLDVVVELSFILCDRIGAARLGAEDNRTVGECLFEKLSVLAFARNLDCVADSDSTFSWRIEVDKAARVKLEGNVLFGDFIDLVE